MVSISSSQLTQLMMYLTQSTQTTTSTTTNTSSPFDTTTNTGWGANAFLNANSSLFSYTKTTTSGNTFTGSNDKKLSVDSALAFSEMALKTTDGKVGDSDGKVSVAEFNKTSSTGVGTTLDVDKDGFVSRSELTAYYLLIDKIDGNQDGKVNANSGNLFNLLAKMAPETIKNMLKGNIDKIKDADATFKLEMPAVDGSKGSYDHTTSLGKFANNGQAAAKLAKSGKLLYTDFQYADKTDLSTGLASMTELQKIQDRNGDGKVSVYENKLSGGKAVDIDKDGYISAGEFLAEVMTADKDGDGKITYSERLYAQKLSESDDYETKVKATYTTNKIAEKEDAFIMPSKTTSTDTGNSTYIQQLIKLLLQMFGCSI